MTVGLLALQGAFLDHIPFAEQAGHKACEVRNARELESCDCLIIPGGESTVLQLYLEEENLAASVKSRVLGGLPVWGILSSKNKNNNFFSIDFSLTCIYNF